MATTLAFEVLDERCTNIGGIKVTVMGGKRVVNLSPKQAEWFVTQGQIKALASYPSVPPASPPAPAKP
jgi:hypothetical protein